MAEDIRCAACRQMLKSLVNKTKSWTEDHIGDTLDGELAEPPPLVDNAQENRVNQNRKGCNKHFKDELLLQGFHIRRCDDNSQDTEGREKGHMYCFEQSPNPATERDVDTYSTRNEAMFYACEHTISRYSLELSTFLEEQLEERGAEELDEVLSEACLNVAKCEGRKKKAKEEPKKKKKKKKQGHTEL